MNSICVQERKQTQKKTPREGERLYVSRSLKGLSDKEEMDVEGLRLFKKKLGFDTHTAVRIRDSSVNPKTLQFYGYKDGTVVTFYTFGAAEQSCGVLNEDEKRCPGCCEF